MWKFIISLAAALVAGCANTPADYSEDIHRAAKTVALYRPGLAPEAPYRVIREIAVESCDTKSTARYAGDRFQARELLQLEAASLGANAVITYHCWTAPVDLTSNCWSITKCEGTAVTYQPGE